MQAVILAGGLGSRLGHLKGDKPKGLLKPEGLSEKSLLARSVGILRSHGVGDIIIGTGYGSEHLEQVFGGCGDITLIKNPHYATTGSAQTLEAVRGAIVGDFLLLESDLLYEERAIEALLKHSHKSLVLASGATHSGDEVFLQLDGDSRLLGLSKNPKELKSCDAELVGISKVGYEDFLGFDFGGVSDYEHLLLGFGVLKIEDLLWCEIDCLEHLLRAQSAIIPRLKKLS